MTDVAVPYSLRPKATKLAEGPDGSLEPSDAPTDPANRTAVPFEWPRVDLSKGGAGPPDAPLAPPGTDPANRTAAPFDWPRGLPGAVPNRPMAELVAPVGDLDPDIALWRQVVVSIWPFTGHPTEGIWPAGWMGIDNEAQPYVCTVGGEPGTWQPIGFTSAGVASFNTRTGPVVLEAADVEALFSAAGQLFVGTGAGSGELLAVGPAGTVLEGGASEPSWGVLPGTLLATTVYPPTGDANYPLATTLTALDTTNLTVTFVVPPSGEVDVEVEIVIAAAQTTNRNLVTIGLLNHTGGAQVGVSQAATGTQAAGSIIALVHSKFHVGPGLLPIGATVTLDLAANYTAGSGSSATAYVSLTSGAITTSIIGGQAIMRVYAA